jgi:glycosyltransferase involved in cell wall biosynthesis
MSECPTVSVIIPCYNQGQYLDEAVDSVLNQTYQDFEIVVINDGSTDLKTLDIIKGYNKPKTKVIHTDNQGLAQARNNGIKASKGKYILPLDADDKIGNIYIEEAVKILDTQEKIGIVYCEAELFGDQTGKWKLPDYRFPDILLGNVIFCSAFFRRSDWEKTSGYNSNMIYGWEDYDFWLSILELGREVYCIPKVLFFYRRHAETMSKRMDREHFIYSYSQIFKNHQALYASNISTVFAAMADAWKNNDELIHKLQQLSLELEQTHSQLQSNQAELEQTHSQLQSNQAELEQTRSQLQSNQAELEQTRSQLQSNQAELERSQLKINAIESSKFWKLRRVWFRVKRILGQKEDE